jgi:hypothetical protein
LAQSTVQEFALNARQVHRLDRHGVHSVIPLTGEPFGSRILYLSGDTWAT